MVDPLFQRVLVNECRSRKIPVIFDEVFTGFWRLGVEVIPLNECYSLIFKIVFHILHQFTCLISSLYFFPQTAAELIHCVPDIACFGKLLTGGIIPLAVTLATNAVFDSFIGDSKVLSVFLEDFLLWVGQTSNLKLLFYLVLVRMEWIDYHIDITYKFYKLGTSGKSLTLSNKMPSSYQSAHNFLSYWYCVLTNQSSWIVF